MANRRMLAASISVSEQVAALGDDFTRLLFTWMIAHADDWGVLPGSPAKVRAIVMPMLNCTNAQVDAALDDMATHDLLWRYDAADGTKLVQFRTWEAYQQGLNKRTAPKLPRYCDVFPELLGNSQNFLPRARAQNGTEENRTEEREKRVRTRMREGNGATADAAPGSLSLPQEKPDAEPEPDADAKVLYDAFVQTLGMHPTNGNERRKWRAGLADLVANGVTAEDVPKLVRQYRAKYGDQIPCHPKAIADNYTQLGVSPHVLNGASRRHPAEDHPDPDPAELARQKRAAFEKYGIPYPPNHRPAVDG